MTVTTYFEKLPGMDADNDLLELWRKSWRNAGWEALVLAQRDAQAANPALCERILNSRELRRGPCPEGYNFACHLRWVAMQAQGGLMVDFDVLNNGFTPDDMRHLVEAEGKSRALFLSGTSCPCAVFATPLRVSEMIEVILIHADQADSGAWQPGGFAGELSFVAHDQAIFERFGDRWKYLKPPVVVERGGTLWEQAPLIHFCNGATPGPRGKFISDLCMF